MTPFSGAAFAAAPSGARGSFGSPVVETRWLCPCQYTLGKVVILRWFLCWGVPNVGLDNGAVSCSSLINHHQTSQQVHQLPSYMILVRTIIVLSHGLMVPPPSSCCPPCCFVLEHFQAAEAAVKPTSGRFYLAFGNARLILVGRNRWLVGL
ncbi:expressed unknown protein [Seminavis robusta]|uniref:Uncharacterized protein n=1 Tax=Seminavis robusta TaxID=568900 RepID=A0A9N8EL95_9STRA|nr:expressed unknown protein [Seminavis robusta]|eukprot:Sro1167_g248330.1 n/a (151) ;mRNA; f:7077-7854